MLKILIYVNQMKNWLTKKLVNHLDITIFSTGDVKMEDEILEDNVGSD